MNCHLEAAYSNVVSHRIAGVLDNSVAAQHNTIILPLFAQMTMAEILRVASALQTAIRTPHSTANTPDAVLAKPPDGRFFIL